MSNVFDIKEANYESEFDKFCKIEMLEQEEAVKNPIFGISKSINFKFDEEQEGHKLFYFVTGSLITIKNNKRIKISRTAKIIIDRKVFRNFKLKDLEIVNKLVKRKQEVMKRAIKIELSEHYQKFSFIKIKT